MAVELRRPNNEDLDGAPSLSQSMIDDMFIPSFDVDGSDRPVASFKLLMDWVSTTFFHALENSSSSTLTNFIHNRICIDENFILFAKERKITIDCLYKDSIISWREGVDLEKFLVQGVFRIYSNDFEFLHSALFHKGCNNEDEISFFITCSSENFEKYVQLRNDFDEWVQLRDRENNEITVIGGENIPYTNENTWEELFLPKNIKSDIQNLVDVFLSSKDWYLENKIPWKKGLFLYGVQGNGKTSIIKTIISQYDFKPVTISPSGNTDDVEEAFNYAETQSPSLLYFEDLDSMLATGQVNLSSFLNFMDGVSSKNGLFVIATANRPELLPANVTDRPSRFDRKFEIPVPDKALTRRYLNRWFTNKINPKTLTKIITRCYNEGFTYAYLKELYVASMYNAVADNRKKPNTVDINTALDRIIEERLSFVNDDTVDVNEYLRNE